MKKQYVTPMAESMKLANEDILTSSFEKLTSGKGDSIDFDYLIKNI